MDTWNQCNQLHADIMNLFGSGAPVYDHDLDEIPGDILAGGSGFNHRMHNINWYLEHNKNYYDGDDEPLPHHVITNINKIHEVYTDFKKTLQQRKSGF